MSIVPATLAQIATDWEALTPPDRTSIVYSRVDGQMPRAGVSGDRTFWFAEFTASGPISQRSLLSSIEHECRANLRLSRAGRTHIAWWGAMLDEREMLRHAIAIRSSWPSGVKAVAVLGMGYETDEDSRDLVATLDLSIYGEEDGS